MDTVEQKTLVDYTTEKISEHDPQYAAFRRSSLYSLRRQDAYLLCCLALGTMQAFMCSSLLLSFYPGEALSHGVSQSVSSWVFAVYPFVSCVTAPIFGNQMQKLGTKRILIAGVLTCGIPNIFFGLLEWLPRDESYLLIYLVLSFGLRTLMALGHTAWITASLTTAMHTFSDNIATVSGLLETIGGVGFMLGPVIGGVLYEFVGFFMTFLISGIFVVAGLPAFYCILENKKECGSEGGCSVLACVRVPSVCVVGVTVCMSAFIPMSTEPLLDLHFGQFGLSSSMVGLTFLLTAGVYTLTAPIVGYFVDKWNVSLPLLITGFVFMTVGLLFLGPSPLIGLHNYQRLWLKLVSLVVLHAFEAFAVVPTYHRLTYCMSEAGFPESISTHGVISGLFTSTYALGEAVGSVFAGVLTDGMGFAWACTWLSLLGLATVVMLSVEYTIEYYGSKRKTKLDEKTAITQSYKSYHEMTNLP